MTKKKINIQSFLRIKNGKQQIHRSLCANIGSFIYVKK
nr:MAG TPA: hypothetical protein [Caudoviricetes sp.]